jgi:hypothetical protein
MAKRRENCEFPGLLLASPLWIGVYLASCGQLEKSAKGLRSLHTHDEALQLLALLLADDIAAQRREFDGNLFLGHGIARIALGNIDAGGV